MLHSRSTRFIKRYEVSTRRRHNNIAPPTIAINATTSFASICSPVIGRPEDESVVRFLLVVFASDFALRDALVAVSGVTDAVGSVAVGISLGEVGEVTSLVGGSGDSGESSGTCGFSGSCDTEVHCACNVKSDECPWWSWEISHPPLWLLAQKVVSRRVTPTGYAEIPPDVLRWPESCDHFLHCATERRAVNGLHSVSCWPVHGASGAT